jgi:hypothetical protein
MTAPRPPGRLVRLADGIASAYRRQIDSEHQTAIRDQFAALDQGIRFTSALARRRHPAPGPRPNRDDPLERLWQLPAVAAAAAA